MTRKRPYRKRLDDKTAASILEAEGLQCDIAVRFGVSQAYVSLIKAGKRGKRKGLK